MDHAYTFDADPDETLRGTSSVLRMRKWRWANWLPWPLLGGLILMYRAQGVAWSQLGNLWFAIVFLAAIQILGPMLQRRMIRREFASNPSARAPRRVVFSPTGILTSGGPSRTSVEWEGVRQVAETSEFFLFRTGKYTGFFFPKRAVGSEESLNDLRELLKRSTHVSKLAAT